MLLEIGGGTRNRNGWINLDICDSADIKHDLNILPWPVADQSADQIYTSHCIEHVKSHFDFIHEIVRIAKVGAAVTIKCPDPMSDMAMIWGHEAAFGESCVRHFEEFPDVWWNGCQRKLVLQSVAYGKDSYWFGKARKSPRFADWSDDEILTWIPRTKHDNTFSFLVQSI